jgi:hypothetical protein
MSEVFKKETAEIFASEAYGGFWSFPAVGT